MKSSLAYRKKALAVKGHRAILPKQAHPDTVCLETPVYNIPGYCAVCKRGIFQSAPGAAVWWLLGVGMGSGGCAVVMTLWRALP